MVYYTIDCVIDWSDYIVHCMVGCTIDYTLDYNVSVVHCTVDPCVVSYTDYHFSSILAVGACYATHSLYSFIKKNHKV